MKKQLMVITYIFLLLIGGIASVYKEPIEASAQAPVVIPDEAIRLRILANSDSEKDQSLKRLIRDEVNAEITQWVEKLTSIEEARQLIQSRLPEIEKIVESVLARENKLQSYTVNFNDVSFPTKLYGNYIYPAGDYEAILITLGEGKGANWWCVLFPPLCFLDFSNGEAVQAAELEGTTDKNNSEKTKEELSSLIVDEKEEKVEVKFLLVEWFQGLFS